MPVWITNEALQMIHRIVSAHPLVRTIIFQDDIFVFTKDKRVMPLCEGIIAAKARGELPPNLQFISTNRIDAMTPERLQIMRRAGFRVLGFGIESFSPRRARGVQQGADLSAHRADAGDGPRLGVTPFLDLILSSPRSTLDDVAVTLKEAHRWLQQGCEIGMYPYVIPFSGAAFANDPTLVPHTVMASRRVAGTNIEWQQAAKILPMDPIGARRDPAHRELVRRHALLIAGRSRSSALARSLAAVDSRVGAGHGRARNPHR